ncbi:hypothetical protein Tsubulata_018003 [Turnera subulata]|uniref:Uncharacterized protein n=1 Tax=Turnera subulata TaxID=218843 RepID=A0A9Q0FSG7_9ROSI|nr:hypothetical protein Tsubulata_018003 [Turnera subulata]
MGDDERQIEGESIDLSSSWFRRGVLPRRLETSFDDVVDRDNDKGKKKKTVTEVETENLVPKKWREVQAEINITKKERRRIAYELQFNCRVERKRRGLAPLRDVNLDEYKTYREGKMAQLKPLVQDTNNNNPSTSLVKKESGGERVVPKNPRWVVYGRGLDDVSEEGVDSGGGGGEEGEDCGGGGRLL